MFASAMRVVVIGFKFSTALELNTDKVLENAVSVYAFAGFSARRCSFSVVRD